MNHILSVTAAVAGALLAIGGAQAATGGSASAGSDLMYNGKSVHGSAVAAPPTARQVNVELGKSLNVACGETVTFRKGEKTFSWKFESATHRAVDLRTIAPAGFTDKGLMVYISRNEAERS